MFLMIIYHSSISNNSLYVIHIGYAQTFEEAYERIENIYKEEAAGVVHENPPVEDFLVWRDLRVFDGKLPSPFSVTFNASTEMIFFQRKQHMTMCINSKQV